VPIKLSDETYWYECARDAFALFRRMTRPEAKRLMLEIAAGYQRVAQLIEERTSRKKSSST
jgi:hypothetical protein